MAEKAKAASARALELDPTLAEAHSALAQIQMLLEWDWQGAERSFERAIELNPGYADAHHMYAWLLTAMGRFPESIEQMQIARRLDPVSALLFWQLGVLYHFAGDDELAIPQLEKALELFPESVGTYQPLGMILCEHGEFERGLALLEQARELGGDQAGGLAPIAYGHALAGRTDEARGLLREMERRAAEEFVDPGAFALVHVSLGDHDAAFEWLERAYQMRWPTLPGALAVYPPLAPLRSDPRSQDLLRRTGFPES